MHTAICMDCGKQHWCKSFEMIGQKETLGETSVSFQGFLMDYRETGLIAFLFKKCF